MTRSGSCWLIKFAPCENMDEERSFFFDEYFDVVPSTTLTTDLNNTSVTKAPALLNMTCGRKPPRQALNFRLFKPNFLKAKTG